MGDLQQQASSQSEEIRAGDAIDEGLQGHANKAPPAPSRRRRRNGTAETKSAESRPWHSSRAAEQPSRQSAQEEDQQLQRLAPAEEGACSTSSFISLLPLTSTTSSSTPPSPFSSFLGCSVLLLPPEGAKTNLFHRCRSAHQARAWGGECVGWGWGTDVIYFDRFSFS